jgi:hypothetical protein
MPKKHFPEQAEVQGIAKIYGKLCISPVKNFLLA